MLTELTKKGDFMAKKVRVRSRRLDQLDESKLALAVWLIARSEVEDKTTTPSEPTQTDGDSATAEESA
jgi:hypothetical protein